MNNFHDFSVYYHQEGKTALDRASSETIKKLLRDAAADRSRAVAAEQQRIAAAAATAAEQQRIAAAADAATKVHLNLCDNHLFY